MAVERNFHPLCCLLNTCLFTLQVGVPADREQYIHRLGRTGRKGKEGQGILLLAPWEEFFLSSVKDLPMTKAQVPLVDPDTRKKVSFLCFLWFQHLSAFSQQLLMPMSRQWLMNCTTLGSILLILYIS